MTTPWQSILIFWFGITGDDNALPPQAKMWFKKSEETDTEIRKKFITTWFKAVRGGLKAWGASPDGGLALLLLFDQFSRSLFRNKPEAFSQDPKALALSRYFIDKGWDCTFPALKRIFIYLPLEHSEDLEHQKQSVALFKLLHEEAPDPLKAYLANSLRYAERHKEIIERFGRFPHRNKILGRVSTELEIAFLQQPFSSF